MSLRDRFTGLNAAYLMDQYDRFRRDPESVADSLRQLFMRSDGSDEWHRDVDGGTTADVLTVVGAVNLAESLRRYGHLAARIDPLGGPPPGDPSLVPETHGVTDAMLSELPADLVQGPLCGDASTALEAIEGLRAIYTSSTGHDYAHIFVPEERDWLREVVECGRYRAPNDPIEPRRLLRRLTRVDVFERFLHRVFPGKTRFSIEGVDMLIPVLDEVIGEAAESGIRNVLIGMAHRGRLNVLAHVLYKPYAQILAEFGDPGHGTVFNDDLGWSGDVKYHLGARRTVRSTGDMDLVISLPPNPSHLEAIDPVVEGMARAAGTTVDGPGPGVFDPAVTVPILVHGDFSFPGQGVVAETLNLSKLPGYTTGGTIHIIANNQIGFTTDPVDAYSTLYASGFARGFKVPIVHVNADDPEACIEAARLAFGYLARFRRDFIIDLVGYRRHGHNEGDEPTFTQPRMYRTIQSHPTVREIWARTLVDRQEVDPVWPEQLVERLMGELQVAFESGDPASDLRESVPASPPPGAARSARTAVPRQALQALNEALLVRPDGFTGHRKIERGRERRRGVLDGRGTRTIDWATAEELAFASILADGTAIRVTGQDVERGTFSQRHAVFHDHETGASYVPLQHLPQAKAAFEIHNSPLSENAVLSFEFGYNVQAPERLVIWEAQYGDFINGAQVIIDEFILSARVKWGQTPSLVLLLPHGQEGQGPDHASARMERFLQLAADTNVRIANCTTAAQYFHLLRRQAALLCTDPLPLIVFTPKSLLRHPLVASSTADLTHGGWRAVLDDEDANTRGNGVKRLVLCTGKVYVDLVSSARRAERPDVAIVRVEQLYPFPQAEVASTIARYPRVREIRWVQEEPENMGAWDFVRTRIDACAQGAPPVQVVARPRSASPADGSAARYATNQAAIVEAAFGSSGGSPRRHAGTRKASPTSQASVASMASTTRAVKTKKTTTARAPKRPSAQTRSNRKPQRKT